MEGERKGERKGWWRKEEREQRNVRGSGAGRQTDDVGKRNK